MATTSVRGFPVTPSHSPLRTCGMPAGSIRHSDCPVMRGDPLSQATGTESRYVCSCGLLQLWVVATADEDTKRPGTTSLVSIGKCCSWVIMKSTQLAADGMQLCMSLACKIVLTCALCHQVDLLHRKACNLNWHQWKENQSMPGHTVFYC